MSYKTNWTAKCWREFRLLFCHLFTLINPKPCFFLKKSHYLKKTVMLDIVVIILQFNSIHCQAYDRKLILRQ